MKVIAGESPDRLPAVLWRYWPGDDQRVADLAQAIISFQRQYDWDMTIVAPSEAFATLDYGVNDEWEGNLEGLRQITRRPISRSLDWTELRPLDPARGALGRQLECLRLAADALADETPVVQLLLSPLTQAQQLAGHDQLIRHLRTQPERVHTGLNVITETTLRFLDGMKRMPVAGIFYVTDYANADRLSEDEYKAFGLPYDRKILESFTDRWWLNILHLRGIAPMLRAVSQLPVQVINWNDQEGEPDLTQAKLIFNGAALGGLSRWRHLHYGTPTEIRDKVRAARAQTNGRRYIVGADGPLPVSTPLSTIRAVREAVAAGGT